MPRDSTKEKIAEDLARRVMAKFMRDALDAYDLAAVTDAEREFEAVLLAHTIAVAASGIVEATNIKPEDAGEMFAQMVAFERAQNKRRSRRQEG
jgi:uncharacterized protein with GYD domain